MNRRALIQSLSFLPLLSPMARAEAAKPYKVSLLAGQALATGAYQAGLQIDLAPEWKTYWRMPGNAGSPPEFDWQASQNLAAITVDFPLPKRFQGLEGETIGYQQQVVLPLLVTPKDVKQPVQLVLDMAFAICKELCLPVTAEASLSLPSEPSQQAQLDIWRAKVPKPGAQLQLGPVQAATLRQESTQNYLVLSLRQSLHDVFVESETIAYFGAPQFKKNGQEAWLPIANVKDLTKLSGKRLKLTLDMPGEPQEMALVLP